EELTETDIKRMDADDQAIQTILLGLPENVYAVVDSYEMAKEIWEHVHQMMKENIALNIKFLNNLQPEWKRHVTIVRQTKNLHEADFTQIYDFLKINQEEDRQIQNVRGNDGNQFGQYAGQVAQNHGGNQNGLVVVPGIANQSGTGNVVAARAEGDLDEIEEVNANCILMGNLQQASTSGTQHDRAPVYDTDGSAEETLELAQESREKMRLLKKEIKPANYVKINHLSGVFISQTTKSKEELFLSNVSNMVTVSKTISIPNEDLSNDTTLSVARKFLNEMSSMGELTFFLGLQVKKKKDGIFISQDKYVAEILKKFGLSEGKSASTPIDTEKPLLKDSDGEDVDVHTYRSMIGLQCMHVHDFK
nr:ribonuclease H-like domain, reverse transcriptase, RNA-dependent DNA polymerase [Tanacetum cinerariifolium]